MANESREERLKTQMGSALFYTDPSISQFEMQHTFEPGAELFNMHSGMEIFGSPAWKNQLPHQRDRSYVPWKAASSSSSRNAPESMNGYYPSEFQKPDFSSEFPEIAPESTWQENRLLVEDPSLRCVFPSEQPSQGLSLSLCPNGLQSHQQVSSREGFLGAKGSGFQYVHETPPSFTSSSGAYHLLRDSKYLVSAQELLSEFCNLGIKQKGDTSPEMKPHKSSQWEEGVSSRNQPLCSLDLLELQKRKGKLLSMLEEVDRRYRQYCEQMRGVVSMFEGVAGHGAAAIYLNSASKAMSRHFRCLRDVIVGQIKATKKAMGEKDPIAPGTTRGETPRLKVLDQALRQQRAFQQMGVLESHPWRPQRGLPERSVSVLRAWLFEHFLHPYPTDVDKHILARQTGLSRSQVSNWFINARVRLWKPMVEEMYLEEAKEQEGRDQDGISGLLDSGRQDSGENPNPSSSHVPMDDQKPTITCHDSDSLSSIINNPERNPAGVLDRGSIHKQQQQQQQQEFTRLESFGVVDLDFSSYSHGTSGVTYAGGGDASRHNFASSAGAQGVSLTLGLQQQGGTGVGLTFSPSGPQHSMYFTRQHMEDCQPIQYSILDGETQNLPYRNLMGAQLLHDLAG